MKFTHIIHAAVVVLAQHLVDSQSIDGNNNKSNVDTRTAQVPWTDLLQTLSDGSYSDAHFDPFAKTDDWLNQCMRTFEDDGRRPVVPVSNWNLMDQPSGLCMNVASCAYEHCTGPIQDSIGGKFMGFDYRYNSSIFTDDILVNDDRLNLPKLVVHPKHVGDIAETIKFANDYKIGISVKTSGHSYTGSSTKKDTILMNLRKLKSYSGQVKNGSLVECELVTEPLDGAFADACRLAIARNKPAVIRVGGGEVWNDVLYAVSINWNCGGSIPSALEGLNGAPQCPSPNKNKYHVVSGAAATVSAAGGWLSSGGLSANGGMRMYGLGVDQVLYFEMVLPDGRHVRFGPSGWDDVPGYLYPQTREVTGYCNVGDLSADDESLWVWEECEEAVDFNALWYAVRGGGGGAYGVTTAVYYQLHDYPSQLHITGLVPSDYLNSLEGEERSLAMNIFHGYTSEFFFRFFFIPESIGVSEYASNSCSCPDCQGFTGGGVVGDFFCYNGAEKIFIAAAKRFIGDDFDLYLKVKVQIQEDYESYGHLLIWAGETEYPPGVIPSKKGRDGPSASPLSYHQSEGGHINAPLSVVQSEESMNKLMDILAPCFGNPDCMGGITYILGGDIPFADDGMSALPIHRRNGFLFGRPYDPEIYNKLLDLFYDAEDGEPVTGDNFPGSICHNHASFFMTTPQRDDWTKLCDVAWDDAERHEKCFTFQEATLGVENVKKLEKIHAMIDPNRLFDCADCVGYGDENDNDEKKKKKDKKKNKKLKGKEKNGYDNYPLYCLTGDISLIGNGVCQEALNTQACHYDGGDCK